MSLSCRKSVSVNVKAGFLPGRKRRLHAAAFWLPVILSLLFLPARAQTQEWDFVGSLSVKEEYNDNLFFDDSKARETDDFVTTISPELQLNRSTDRFQLGLSGRLDRRMYASENDLDATDQSYQGSVRYRLTPRLALGGTAGYAVNSSPDRDLEETGLVFGTSKSKRQRYAVSGDYLISETMTGNLSYSYGKSRYEGDDQGDTDSHGVNLVLSRDLGYFLPVSQGRISFGYNRFNYEDASTDTYQMMVGFSHNLSETWRYALDVGGSYARSRYDVVIIQLNPDPVWVKGEEKTSDWGVVGKAQLFWQGQHTNVSFYISRDIAPAGDRGTTSNRTALGCSVNRQFTEQLSANLFGRYFLNKADRDEYSRGKIDEETASAGVGLRYAFTKDLSLDVSYTYTKTEYNVEKTDAERNLFMIRLYIRHAFLN